MGQNAHKFVRQLAHRQRYIMNMLNANEKHYFLLHTENDSFCTKQLITDSAAQNVKNYQHTTKQANLSLTDFLYGCCLVPSLPFGGFAMSRFLCRVETVTCYTMMPAMTTK